MSVAVDATATVTGRTYKSTRVRGFSGWSPHAKTRIILDQVVFVLEEYVEYLPLTIRQVFYRLVGVHDYPKTQRDYGRLCEYLNRARRSGIIPFDAIRDDGQTSLLDQSFTGLPEFWQVVGQAAQSYRLDRQEGQGNYLEVWCESAGMAPQLAAAANPFGIPVYSSGGFDSLTVKYDAASRFADRKSTTVLHVGDYDASGCSVVDSASEDISSMAADIDSSVCVAFERVAVTPAQIAELNLPTAPPKRTDLRGDWGDDEGTVQAEALAPEQLRVALLASIDDHINRDTYKRVLRQESQDRDDLLRRLERLGSAE